MCEPVTMMMGASLLASSAGSLLGGQAKAGAQSAQDQAASQNALYQRANALQQKQAVIDQTMLQTVKTQQRANAFLGRQDALVGASGAMGGMGSLPLLDASTTHNEYTDMYAQNIMGQQQEQILQNSANSYQSQASNYDALAASRSGTALTNSLLEIGSRGMGMAAGMMGGGGGGAGSPISAADTMSAFQSAPNSFRAPGMPDYQYNNSDAMNY